MAQPTYQQLLDVIARKDRQIAQLEGRVGQLERRNRSLEARNAQLEARNRELETRNHQLEAQVVQLQARVAQLEQLVDKTTRAGKRQAAPFSKGGPKKNPKKPGRKSGNQYGPQAHRSPPAQEPEEVFEVPLPKQCEACGGPVREDHIDHQYQVEIPRQPIVRRFDIHIGECQRCGRRVQPRHELQTSDAIGAAASQLGPDLQAMIAMMKDKYGLSYGDISGLLEEGFGIEVSRGGAAHVVLRVAERARGVYEGLKAMVRGSDAVYPDETGWKVGALLHWMWAFVTNVATVYVIRPSRGRDVPQEVLGADYAGRMIHDGWSPYDSFVHAIHQQCLEHLLRRATELLEQSSGAALRFPRKVKKFLLDALALRDRRDAGTISGHGLAVARGRLEKRLDRLLDRQSSHEGNRTFRDHLARHRDEILTFLYHEDIEATNWPAEQAMRPAVVNRKVFGGNRTPAGARAQEVLGSVFATCTQNAIKALTLLSHVIRAPAPAT
ncbi:MAG: IS66 family transposase [Planctomycetota bacterium]